MFTMVQKRRNKNQSRLLQGLQITILGFTFVLLGNVELGPLFTTFKKIQEGNIFKMKIFLMSCC